jgi:hypothetical protein
MDHQEHGTPAEPTSPRRKLQVARETLRQLGASALRNVAGGQEQYHTNKPPTEDFTCEGWACTDNCPTVPECNTGMECMTFTNEPWCETYACG